MLKNSKTVDDQYDRFIEAARKLGCYEDEVAFDDDLRVGVGPEAKTRPEAAKDDSK